MIRDEQHLAALLERVRRFMRELAIPNEERVERENAIPEDIVDEMRRLGFFGRSIPEEYGGAGYCEDIGGSVPRFYRDVRLFRLYEGTSQIHQLNIARHLLRGDR